LPRRWPDVQHGIEPALAVIAFARHALGGVSDGLRNWWSKLQYGRSRRTERRSFNLHAIAKAAPLLGRALRVRS
jgi:hypothetical protein